VGEQRMHFYQTFDISKCAFYTFFILGVSSPMSQSTISVYSCSHKLSIATK
jgi:hypothetical protein